MYLITPSKPTPNIKSKLPSERCLYAGQRTEEIFFFPRGWAPQRQTD